MFKKPFKIKTSTTIKGSDRRRLRALVESSFPNLSADDLNQLISNKGEMSQAKAMTHSGSIAMIYSSGTNPVFFQVEDRCYPTMYTLWKYQNLLPMIVTNFPVLEKISNGADLMAPGVILTDSTSREMADLKLNDMCAVRIWGNMSPIAVGIAVMSKEELCQDNVKGKAVTIAHSYQDTLWQSGDQQDPPIIPQREVSEVEEKMENLSTCDGQDSYEEDESDFKDSQENTRCMNDGIVTNNEVPLIDEVVDCDEVPAVVEKTPEYTMDEVLLHSFLTTIKASGKKITLPILASTFYSTFVLKCCPPSLNLDIKKTTHKKVSVFLKKMQKEGVIQIKELSKGVESIVSMNVECDTVKLYRIEKMFKMHLNAEKEKCVEEIPTANIQGNYKFPLVTELFVVSAQVKVLFEKFKMRKGDSITSASIRDILKCYVKDNSLQKENNPREVVLDPILTDCVPTKGDYKSVMTWEELHDAIAGRMPPAYQIEFENKAPVVKKGKLEPIQVTVDTRTGNKKVTLIHNLETYGINPEKLAQHAQVAVAASTSLLPTQNAKGTIVLIQGNQVRFLHKLFLETYKVPRKYLQGLENIPAKKK